jgi:hypothetical protein
MKKGRSDPAFLSFLRRVPAFTLEIATASVPRLKDSM